MRPHLGCTVAGLALLLCGCAAQQITGPSKTIGNEVATFQGSLSAFQDTLKITQDDTRATILGSAARANTAVAVTKQLEVEWVIARAKSEADILAALQASGKAESTQFLAPAGQSTPPASVTFPLDTLSAVARTLDELAKGPTARANLDILSAYGKKVMTQLKALEDQAKSAAASPEKSQ